MKGTKIPLSENGLKVNSVNNKLLTTASMPARNVTNPFVSQYPNDAFESAKDSPFVLKKVKKPAKKTGVDILKQKFSDFIQAQQFMALANKQEIENMIMVNPNIDTILRNSQIPKVICIENLTDIYEEHLAGTLKISRGIGENIGLSKKEMKILEKGALFHDFGKVLIPQNLLNKPDKLTPEEQKIVGKHAILGYELLKTTNLEPEVLEIVKNHHKYKYNLDNNQNNLLSQIVTVADIYSALTTKRAYKNAMTSDKAMKILDKLCDENKVNRKVVNALKMSIEEEKTAA